MLVLKIRISSQPLSYYDGYYVFQESTDYNFYNIANIGNAFRATFKKVVIKNLNAVFVLCITNCLSEYDVQVII